MSIVGKYLNISNLKTLLKDLKTSITSSCVRLSEDQTINGVKYFTQGPYGKSYSLGSKTAIDLSYGNVFTKTISADTTFTITNVPSSKVATFILILTNGGSKVVTWPASVKWPGGEAPELTASGVDVLTFITPNGGTTWYGVPSSIGAA